MAGKNTAVFGIYRTRADAENGVDQLITSGFRSEDVSVLLQDNLGTKDFAHEKHTKAPEGTATGAVTGGVIGGTLGLLAGIGALAIPGVGPFIAAGPIMGALAGMAPAGSSVGLSARWSEWGFQSLKPSVTKAESRRGVFFSPFTVITATG